MTLNANPGRIKLNTSALAHGTQPLRASQSDPDRTQGTLRITQARLTAS